ncbi:zinc finger protein CONSTANS-LIKE 2-like [Neltuma alba]|uniref:zinc finger protein CONSTANS-LIKE 2-like n=1 Tax=Neltuma alba TaxID=207710 RepID=UPI0010A30D7A|nr:zinc finger protein CONSTANS-LIKE 2-like [Prosopis alba]
MKNCELCRVPARTYCESDQASLCWDCDAKVHGANFLVARHSRTLLCHACQSPTPWKASGAVLGNTVSVCRNCDGGMNLSDEDGEGSEGGNDTETNSEDDDDDAMLDENNDDDADGDEVGGDGEADHQIVPWSSSTPPPPATSSSSDESNNGNRNVSESRTAVSLKRRRENASKNNFQGPTDGG